MSYRGLIRAAEAVLNPYRSGDRLFGDVAAALITTSGRQFLGVCIDTGSGTGFCAEHAAIAAMVTAGEYQISSIVAVWRDDGGRLTVLPPCGRCREFIRQVDGGNLDTEVVLGWDRAVPLRELLPHSGWPEPLEPGPPEWVESPGPPGSGPPGPMASSGPLEPPGPLP